MTAELTSESLWDTGLHRPIRRRGRAVLSGVEPIRPIWSVPGPRGFTTFPCPSSKGDVRRDSTCLVRPTAISRLRYGMVTSCALRERSGLPPLFRREDASRPFLVVSDRVDRLFAWCRANEIAWAIHHVYTPACAGALSCRDRADRLPGPLAAVHAVLRAGVCRGPADVDAAAALRRGRVRGAQALDPRRGSTSRSRCRFGRPTAYRCSCLRDAH